MVAQALASIKIEPVHLPGDRFYRTEAGTLSPDKLNGYGGHNQNPNWRKDIDNQKLMRYTENIESEFAHYELKNSQTGDRLRIDL